MTGAVADRIGAVVQEQFLISKSTIQANYRDRSLNHDPGTTRTGLLILSALTLSLSPSLSLGIITFIIFVISPLYFEKNVVVVVPGRVTDYRRPDVPMGFR